MLFRKMKKWEILKIDFYDVTALVLYSIKLTDKVIGGRCKVGGRVERTWKTLAEWTFILILVIAIRTQQCAVRLWTTYRCIVMKLVTADKERRQTVMLAEVYRGGGGGIPQTLWLWPCENYIATYGLFSIKSFFNKTLIFYRLEYNIIFV